MNLVARISATLGMPRDQVVVVGSVIVTTFFVGFGGGIVFPIIPNLGVVLGISPFMVGLILSANRFSRLLANAPAGAIVDRVGTRTPFVTGVFVQAIATFGYVIALLAPFPSFWFLSARVVWGVGGALVFATAYTIAADVSDGSTRGTSMGMIRGGVFFGAPTGLVIGGVISELFGEIRAFLLATFFALLATWIAFGYVPETHVHEGVREVVAPWEIELTRPAVTVGLVNFSVFFVYIGALFATLVLYLPDREISIFGYGPQASSGVFMAISVVIAGGAMFLGGVYSDRSGSRVPILAGSLAMTGGGFLLLAVADTVLTLTLACVLIGGGQGGTSGPLMALLADLTAGERMGRAVGTTNVLGDVGGGLGPMISLPLIELVGFPVVYVGCAVLPLLAIVILLVGVDESANPASG